MGLGVDRSVGPVGPGDDERRWPGIVLGFVLAALLLNGTWLALHPPGPESGETPHWWPIVLNVAGGHGYVACFPEYFPSCRNASVWPTAAREPLPVLLFAGVARLSGNSLLAASIVEALLDVLVLVALLLLAREVAGARIALVAGTLWLTYLPAKKLIPQISGGLLAALGVVAALHFFLRARRTGKTFFYLASGLALGLAGLSRSAFLAVGPVLFGTSLLQRSLDMRRRMAAAGAILLGVGIPLAPWVVRNVEVFGKPVVGSTLVGYNLFRQNHQLPTGSYLRFVAGAEAGEAMDRLRRDFPALRTARNEVDSEAVYREAAIGVILQNPGRYAILTGYRFLLLWFGWGYLQAYGKEPEFTDYLVMAEQALLLSLALIGVRRLGAAGLPLAASVIAVTLVHMAVIGQLRFIVPAMPLTMILGAAGAGIPPRLRRAVRERSHPGTSCDRPGTSSG